MTLELIVATLMPLAVFAVALALMLYRHEKLPAHQAMIIFGSGRVRVTFMGGLVFPVIQRSETLDLRIQRLSIARTGMRALTCKDGVRVDVTLVAYIVIRRTARDVESVVSQLGSERASDPEVLHELFHARFDDALEEMAAHFTYEQLLASQAGEAQGRLIERCGRDLGGFVIETACLTSLSPSDESTYDTEIPAQARGLESLRLLKAASS